MKELVVISGKGGTGKTSLVVALASLAKNKVIADCDVDAADVHLILNPKIRQKEDFLGGKEYKIDQARCKKCDKCHEVCSFGAIQIIEDKYSVDPFKCEGCGVCAWFCFHEAISSKPKVAGEWFISDTSRGSLSHAALGINEDNSGKLVSKVREKAREEAARIGADLIIVDGSPGIGCPVIASITGAKLVLVVTEPTVSGVHDLKRVIELIKHFNLEAMVCINKFDLNLEKVKEIEDFCQKNEIEIAGLLPYDPNFTKAQLEGKTIIEYESGETSGLIKKMWEKIDARIA